MPRMTPLVMVSIVAFLATGPVSAQTGGQSPMTGTRLDITAEGSVNAVPDLALVQAGVVSDAPTASDAVASNARKSAAMLAALKAAGIADRDIQTSRLSLDPQYRYEDGKSPVVSGYQASTQFSIRFRDVRRAGSIIDLLVARGANQIGGPSLMVESVDPLLDQARGKAMATARARADIYAKAAGMRVRRILSISEGGGGYTPSPPMPMLRAQEAKADTALAPGEQKLAVTIAVSFELE